MSEDKLKRKCVSWLKKNQNDDVWFYCPTDKFYSGIPDIFLCVRGRVLAVELKTEKGKVSEIQTWTHEKIRKAGGIVSVIRGFEEFKSFIEVALK